jgi:hypothetical protein
MERVSESKLPIRVLRLLTIYIVDAGDSGSWVVHAAAPELYGHVVATNVFGDAYVMPALDVLENMRQCLGVTSVTLPTARDFEESDAEHKASRTEIGTDFLFNEWDPPEDLRHYVTANPCVSPCTRSSVTAADTSCDRTSHWSESHRELGYPVKKWNVPSEKPNDVPDVRFMQILERLGKTRTLLDAFLDPYHTSVSFELELACRFFCDGAANTTNTMGVPKADFDYAYCCNKQESRFRRLSINADELRQVLEHEVKFSVHFYEQY